MREIKFRAWDVNNNKMYESYCVDDEGNFCVNIDYTNDLETLNINNIIQMQYTGLKDKKGVEIYEGDIVTNYYTTEDFICKKTVEDSYYKTIEHTSKCVVSWDSHWGSWKIHNGAGRGQFEVIGNIYENPELLKSEV